MDNNNKQAIKRIGGYLHKIVTIKDASGKVIQTVMAPFMVELRPRDIMQIIIGATVLAIPVGLTEETWLLAQELSSKKVALLGLVSILFLSFFIYFNFYRYNIKGHIFDYIKRILATYLLSLTVVGVLLTIIDKCPWATDGVLAIKRVIITAFPASMAATLTDTIK